MHFIYYINKLTATKVDSIDLGIITNNYSYNVLWRPTGAREPVTSRSQVGRLADCATQVDIYKIHIYMSCK